jgi:hypothetical protein
MRNEALLRDVALEHHSKVECSSPVKPQAALRDVRNKAKLNSLELCGDELKAKLSKLRMAKVDLARSDDLKG